MFSVYAGLLPVNLLSICTGNYLTVPDVVENPVRHSFNYSVQYMPRLSPNLVYVLVCTIQSTIQNNSVISVPSVRSVLEPEVNSSQIKFKPGNKVNFHGIRKVSLREVKPIKKEYSHGTIFVENDE